MKSIRAIILAAGRGTRMKSRRPKPLHFIHSRPMLRYLIDAVEASGVEKIILVLGRNIDKIKGRFAGFNIARQKKQLGSGDAVNSAKKYFQGYSGDVMVLYSDTPLLKPETLKRLISTHKKGDFGCTILTAKPDNPESYGRIIRKNGEITKIVEDKDASPDETAVREINIGAYIFKKKTLFNYIDEVKMNPKKKEYYLTDVVNILKKSGVKIGSFRTKDLSEGIGINSLRELADAHDILARKAMNRLMKKGVTITNPATTSIDPEAVIGRDTIVYPNTVIEGNVKIGEDCRIGPFARLRPGTKIKNGVKIGNFVELVRTKVGNNTKIKHLTYLGDAEIGKNVNIGAGTITANFDGIKKHKTIIEDGVSIGVGAVLIAPVKIGRKALIGAGAVVTKKNDIPAGKTAVGVPARILK